MVSLYLFSTMKGMNFYIGHQVKERWHKTECNRNINNWVDLEIVWILIRSKYCDPLLLFTEGKYIIYYLVLYVREVFPILFSKLSYKNGQGFLDTQCYSCPLYFTMITKLFLVNSPFNSGSWRSWQSYWSATPRYSTPPRSPSKVWFF